MAPKMALDKTDFLETTVLLINSTFEKPLTDLNAMSAVFAN